jgi:iron complex outermembrane recepter protein
MSALDGGAVTVKHCRSIASCACALALLMCMLWGASARAADRTYHFDIPAEALSQALRAFGQTAGEQIIFTEDLVSGITFSGLRGDFSAEVALQRLLQGTGLMAERTPAGVIMIRRVSRSTKADYQNTSPTTAPSPAGAVPVAQANQVQASSPATVEKESGQPPKKKSDQLEEVIVTGSRIPTVAGNEVQPVQSYTRQDIERSGQTTVSDFLNTLPDVSVNSSEAFNLNGVFPGMTTVQLHGLPVGSTLILINGRRLESNVFGFFDLSNIPSSAVERIDILPMGASAIYGADALGGAVNIILRRDINGLEVNGQFAHAIGVSDSHMNLDWGKSWEDGSISLIGTYQDRGELLGSEREPTSRTNFPPGAPSYFVTDSCAPGNVYSLNGQNLPGLSAPDAGIPAGISGTPTTQQFAATAGKLNECNGYLYTTLVVPTHREGVLLSANESIAERADLFADVLFTHEDLTDSGGALIGAYGGSYGGTILGATNPYNPFGEAVGVSFKYPEVPDTQTVSEDFIRPLIGLRGSLFEDWDYEAAGYFSRDEFHSLQPNFNATLLQNALNSSDPATAWNPFVIQGAATPQLTQSLSTSLPANDYAFVDELTGGQVMLRGSLAPLPAGPLQTAAGAEFSHESLAYRQSGAAPIDLHRISYATFAEMRVPLLSSRNGSAGNERLALTLAGRYDHSSDYGGKATWQGGLLWRATESLLFRGGYGISYKAPLLQQLAGGIQYTTTGNFGFVDPFRGDEPVNSQITVGQNSHLQPETGNSQTIGIVYSSQALTGLKASLTYFYTRIADYIWAPAFQVLIDNPEDFPAAITRAPPSPQDVAKGWLGPITNITSSYYNFGNLDVAGVDADLRYDIDTAFGRLTPSAAVANIYKWTGALTPQASPISYLSQATINGPGFAPRWKGTAALAWQSGPLSASVSGRYVGRYKDYQDYAVSPLELGDFWVFDVNARYEIGKGLLGQTRWLTGTYLAVGAINLFDHTPQLSYGGGIPFDPAENDIRGRFLYVQLGAKW